MNRKQKIVLWVGIVIIVLMGLFPPVRYKRYSTYRVRYEFLLVTQNTVVVTNLLVQWVVVSIIGSGLIYTFRDKRKQKGESPKTINLTRGFKRITLVLAILAAVICGVLVGAVPIKKYQVAISRSRLRLVLDKPADKRWEKDPIIKASDPWLEEAQKNATPETSDPWLEAATAVSEKSWWATLSKPGLVGIVASATVGGAAIGYCGVWLGYYFLEWLVLGFCAGADTGVERKREEKLKRFPPPASKH